MKQKTISPYLKESMKIYTATLISIGDELLIGQTINTNATWMAAQLNDISIQVKEVLTISDGAVDIKSAMDRATKQSDVVLLTGGLGPTKDDITKKTLAEYFNTELVLNEEILEILKTYYAKRNRPLLQSTAELAYVPANCTVIYNKKGTAAGMWWNKEGTITVSMPGVPYEMKAMMEERVLPRLKKLFKLPVIVHKTLMCAGLGESIIAEKIKTVEENLPDHIKLAYLPNLGILRLRLSGYGTHKIQLENEIAHCSKQIAALLQNYHYGFDGITLQETLQKSFIENGWKLALAESCTGGEIAAHIVKIPGSSAYFMGGIVAYDYDVKENVLQVDHQLLQTEGAVNQQTVEQMAKNVLKKMQADFSIAVSGIAGPDGGSDEKPVGTVWIAVASKEKVEAKKLFFPLDRHKNILLSTNYALYFLWRFIQSKFN